MIDYYKRNKKVIWGKYYLIVDEINKMQLNFSDDYEPGTYMRIFRYKLLKELFDRYLLSIRLGHNYQTISRLLGLRTHSFGEMIKDIDNRMTLEHEKSICKLLWGK